MRKIYVIELDFNEDIDDVDVVDRIIEGVCDQMGDIDYELNLVEEYDQWEKYLKVEVNS